MYLLAVDGGGTKTVARLQHAQSGQHWQQQAGAASLTNNLPQAVMHVRQLVDALCLQAGINSQHITAVMGLAGAGNTALAQQFNAQLGIAFHALQITTDARTSLYGANSGQPVVAVALGTGSVAMALRPDQTEKQTGGWGFAIGDEGGGAWLGKQAMRQLLWEFDCAAGIHSTLSVALSQQTGTSKVALLQWLKNAQATDYAALTPTIVAYAGQCVVAQQLMQQHATAVSQLINYSLGNDNLPVVLLGGLAEITQPYLPAQIQLLLQAATGTALDGALILADRLAAQSHNI